MKTMNDLDKMTIEEIIRQPFFHSLEKQPPNAKEKDLIWYWKIVFRCNRFLPNGQYQLLDIIVDHEFVVRYKIIDFESRTKQ